MCEWCAGPIPATLRSDARFCSRAHKTNSVSRRWVESNPERRRDQNLAHKERRRSDPEKAERDRQLERLRYRIHVYGEDIGEDPLNYTKDRYRHARAQGYRSGLEVALAKQLEAAAIPFDYEKLTIPWVPKPKKRRYTPDYVLLKNGIIVESKGRFITADRSKHKEVKEQHPDLDIRFVFSSSKTRISKQSQTTYAMWCVTHGFQYADKVIPAAWLRESPNEVSLAAIKRIMEA